MSSQKDLKALQQKWYKKLAKSGFKDIEDTNSSQEYLKNWDSYVFKTQYTPAQFQAKERYYQLCRDMLYKHTFANKTEYNIWAMHSEGADVRSIGKRVRKSKDFVAAAVRRLRKNISGRF